MQVILLERVPKLGIMGEVVKVRNGFARNYLIPQGKALRATEGTIKDFESRRHQLEARNLEQKAEAQQTAGRIAGSSVTILRQASEGNQLYGSVSARDIAVAFTAGGISIDRAQVRLEQPIKMLGIHDVVVALHPEVEVTLKVNVARSEEEADIQAGRAQPVTEDEEEEADDEPLDPLMAGLEEELDRI